MAMQRDRTYRFVQVDVFTDHIFGGNPLAVFPHAEGLTDVEMQAIATEMNLAETTFVLPPTHPDCVARVRIFTPGRELPFAGHPTIGTTYVLASGGMLPDGTSRIQLEEGIGPVPVRLEGDLQSPSALWMRHRDAIFGPPVEDASCLAAALGLVASDLLSTAPPVVGSTGVPFLYIPLRDPGTVDRALLNVPLLLECAIEPAADGVFIFAPAGEPGVNRVYSRMFAPHTLNIPEDPATGGASGPLGAYLVRFGLVRGEGELSIVSEQGTKMGRQSFIHIRLQARGGEPHDIEIGGSVVPVLEGTLRLPPG